MCLPVCEYVTAKPAQNGPKPHIMQLKHAEGITLTLAVHETSLKPHPLPHPQPKDQDLTGT